MIEQNTLVKSKTAFLNPFPFLLLLILLIMSLLMSDRVDAAEREMFCTTEQIQNFEDMGLNNSSNVFYFLSNGTVYDVYSYYDNVINYDDTGYVFTVDNDYLTIGHIGEDGHKYVDGYSPTINMYDYKDSCILKVSDKATIKVNNKTDIYLTNNGIELINKYTACPNDSSIRETLCCTLVLTSDLFRYAVSNYIIIIVITFGIVLYCIDLYNKTKGGVIR